MRFITPWAMVLIANLGFASVKGDWNKGRYIPVVEQKDEKGQVDRFYFDVPLVLQRGNSDCARTVMASLLSGPDTDVLSNVYRMIGDTNQRAAPKKKDPDYMAWNQLNVDVFDFGDLRAETYGWSQTVFKEKLKDYLVESATYSLNKGDLYLDEPAKSKLSRKLIAVFTLLMNERNRPLIITTVLKSRSLDTRATRVTMLDLLERRMKSAQIRTPEHGTPSYASFRNALEWRLLDLPMRIHAQSIEDRLRERPIRYNPLVAKVWLTGLEKPECLSSLPISTAKKNGGPLAMGRSNGHYVAIAGGVVKNGSLQRFLVHDPDPGLANRRSHPECNREFATVERDDGFKEIAGQGLDRFETISPTDLTHLMVGSWRSMRLVEIENVPRP